MKSCLPVFIFLSLTISGCYIPRTLWYQFPDLDDHRIFRNRNVDAGTVQPLDQSLSYNNTEIPAKYLEDLKRLESTAYLVIRNDSIITEKYFDDGGAEVLSNSFSMSKSFVSFLIGFAIQDGYLKSTDQPVSGILPWFAENGKEKVKICDLLTMTGGIEWREAHGGVFGPVTQAYYGKNLEKMIRKLKQEKDPGGSFSYQSINTQILALVIETATGKTPSEYMSEKLWKPLGAEKTALWSLDRKDGDEKAYCCFNAVARDYARLGLFMLHSGNWKGVQLLNEDYMKQCFNPAPGLLNRKGEPFELYGLHCWTMNYKEMKIDMAIGLGGQYIISIPAKNIVIIRLGHKMTYEGNGYFPQFLYSTIDAGLELAYGRN